MTAPLIVTLTLDDATRRRFDAERARLFPRTQVGAHVTLFHAVPGELVEQVRLDLRTVAGPAFAVSVEDLVPLGRGVAYRLASPELTRRHGVLQRAWWPYLTRQDRQGFRPHVTVQNKVSPAEARATLATLQAAFVPVIADALGWTLWRYDGGPWTELDRIAFPR